jgi:hypothetical protein
MQQVHTSLQSENLQNLPLFLNDSMQVPLRLTLVNIYRHPQQTFSFW